MTQVSIGVGDLASVVTLPATASAGLAARAGTLGGVMPWNGGYAQA